MLTSQFAYWWNSRTAPEEKLLQKLAAEAVKSDMGSGPEVRRMRWGAL